MKILVKTNPFKSSYILTTCLVLIMVATLPVQSFASPFFPVESPKPDEQAPDIKQLPLDDHRVAELIPLAADLSVRFTRLDYELPDLVDTATILENFRKIDDDHHELFGYVPDGAEKD